MTATLWNLWVRRLSLYWATNAVDEENMGCEVDIARDAHQLKPEPVACPLESSQPIK